MLGCFIAVLLVLSASAAGLGVLLLASPKVFEVLRYLGVAYLIWIGIKAWRSNSTPLDTGILNATSSRTPVQLFHGGLLVGLSNPKLLLFAAAFLPQFIDPSQPKPLQFIFLIFTFSLCELFWYVCYALGGHQLRGYLSRPALQHLFDRFTGAIFVGFGVMLLRCRPQ